MQPEQDIVSGSLVLRVVLLCWLFTAIIVGETGVLSLLPMPALQVIILVLTLAVLAAFRSWGAFHDWILGSDPRRLIAFHLTRFVGIYFLILYAQGKLPYEFAIPAGYGDIVVAALATGLLFIPQSSPSFRGSVLAWNVIGLADIIIVVFIAAKLGMQSPESMHALTELPLSLLPTFLVPLIIATHLLIFLRIARG